jgi:hypothetical protein
VEFLHPSLAEINEGALVTALAANRFYLDDLRGIKGIASDCRPLTGLSFKGLPGNFEGDVDLLLVPPERPDQATAVEVKRIKFDAKALRTGRPNKLQELKKELRQAKTLGEIGFWQVYLYVFVVVDSREQNRGQETYARLTTQQESAIDDALASLQLPRRVGLIRYDFIQPMDHAPLPTGAGGIGLVHLAEPEEQPQAVTEWVRRRCPTTR